MTAIIEHKQNSTFRLDAQWLVSGAGDDLGSDRLICVMENENLRYEFSVSPEYEASGEFTIFAPKEDTAAWPLGEYNCDILRETPAGERTPTQTFIIKVIPSPSAATA